MSQRAIYRQKIQKQTKGQVLTFKLNTRDYNWMLAYLGELERYHYTVSLKKDSYHFRLFF